MSNDRIAELEDELKYFDQFTSDETIIGFIAKVDGVVSGTSALDRAKTRLKLSALRVLRLHDSTHVRKFAWEIISGYNASWRQKYRAFRIWLGIGDPS